MKQTIVCMKWGTRYPAIYVNTLWSMIKRNTRRPTRLVCYTDDSSGVDPAVECLPLQDIPLPEHVAKTPWRKINLWRSDLAGVAGDVLFVDLDIVITGSLDELFDFRPEATFCVIENWTQMGSKIGNTSVFRFRVGAHPYIATTLAENPDSVLSKYAIEQVYISDVITEKVFWPAEWIVSFKHTLLPRWPKNFFQTTPLPHDTKIVCFTGKPDPDEARDGRWPAIWYKKTYKFVRPTPWIAEHWR